MALIKVVNTSDKPFEFTWDGLNFPAIAPGGVAEYPEEIARHALRKSVVLDDEGQDVVRRLELFQAVSPAEKDRLNKILLYDCPFSEIDGCKAPQMKRDEFIAHLEEHKRKRQAPQKGLDV